MKWFKHDSNASTDAKLQRVRMKYGMEGYGVYWYLLEQIASGVEKHNLTFELEHDCDVISFNTGIHRDIVQEMMTYFVEQNLFENIDGAITCMKMMSRADDYIGRLVVKELRTNSEQTPNKLVVNRTEQKRTEQKRTEQKDKKGGRFAPPSLKEVSKYCESRGNTINPVDFFNHYEANGWFRGKTKIKDWKACIRTWESKSRQPQKITRIGNNAANHMQALEELYDENQ